MALLLVVTVYVVWLRDDTETKDADRALPARGHLRGQRRPDLGVNVGRVTAVTPEGNSVRVDMEYDAQYRARDAKAVIVTPTLVADRFVQLTPAYQLRRRLMAERCRHPAARHRRPGRAGPIYCQPARPLRGARTQRREQGRHALTTPRGGRHALKGKGRARQPDADRLAPGGETFGDASGRCSTPSPARGSTTLAENDRFVRAFIRDLAGVSGPARRRGAPRSSAALAAVARAVGTVQVVRARQP